MGIIRKTTLRIVFIKFTVLLIAMLAVSVALPYFLLIIAINAGLATSANQTEAQVRAFVPVLQSAPDISKLTFPPGCSYVIYDKSYHELYSDISDEKKALALDYAKGEYRYGSLDDVFMVALREDEICVLSYPIVSSFTSPLLAEYFPSPEALFIIFAIMNCLLGILFLVIKFAKVIRLQLEPLIVSTREIADQNLDFQVGHASIREFDDALISFSEMKDSLRESLEQKWRMEQAWREQIAALAHDLKTPLTVIQGNADLIGETKLDKEQSTYVGYIADSSGQMKSYITELIELSKASAGFEIRRNRIDTRSFLERIRRDMLALCVTKNVGLNYVCSGVPECIEIDQNLMKRAILNIVHNALEHTPEGEAIQFDASGSEDLRMVITDTGNGFSQEGLLHATEQFYMEDGSRSSQMHHGIGLYIAESIITQHGGRLTLQNDPVTHGAQVVISIHCQGS